MKKFVIAALLTAIALADTKEEPVGLILNPGGGKVLRANTETPLAAKAGDLLFSGDSLKTEAAAATFLYCPMKELDTLSPQGEVRVDAKAQKVKTGKVTPAPAQACTLPQALRVSVASNQHYGVTMTRGVSTDYPIIARDKLPADVQAALKPFDDALKATPNDPAALLAMAALFEDKKLPANALDAYTKLRAAWPDMVWIKQKIFELEEGLAAQTAEAAAAGPGGKTYALLIGVSKYKKPELALQFAHQDALDFGKLLASPRGGGLPKEDMLILTDENATTAAVRNGFQDFLKRKATKKDTVIILMAGHGTVEKPGTSKAYILTHDADPQDLNSTALPVSELQDLFGEQVQRVGRVLLFVDVCKSGVIGTIKNTSINGTMGMFGDVEGEMLGLLASRGNEVSQESPDFGGGHGVFSYYVLKGLLGEADDDKSGGVDAGELMTYVTTQVAKATKNKQHAQTIGNGANEIRLSDTTKPGIEIAMFPQIYDVRNGGPLLLAQNQAPQLSSAASAAVDRFNAAVQAGRILPTGQQNAFDALAAVKATVSNDRFKDYENQLRVALEDKGQEALLKYLAGDENPQSREDFAAATQYMEAARILTKESIYLEGRSDFFQGRTLLFDKKYADAANLLEQSVRFDPAGAYTYNALGIAYLEQAQFDKALPAFRDAARLAQHWAYPLHNAALAYAETGDYQRSIRSYQQAMKLAPKYSYLPYNLGLVYQRTNRKKDAEVSYRKAMSLAPNSAEPYNALGSLKASEGKRTEAEQLYRQALQKRPSLLAARHNLALLLSADANRRQEAIELWRENLRQDPSHLPSRLSLAETLGAAGDTNNAINEYRTVLKDKPGYTAARVALAALLVKSGDNDGAVAELRQASQADAQNADLLERIGDIESARGRKTEAGTAYDAAAKLTDKAGRKRLDAKRKRVL